MHLGEFVKSFRDEHELSMDFKTPIYRYINFNYDNFTTQDF